ncbi:TPA: helix-turn-helix domain-containing protein [Serratia rubidaea]|nr:helix-turn-helix domain-containing protein [Serratia rubidaea]HDJ1447223.1 helix-turn-helix domain-containing protein [Serratia rubidaea]HDJ1463250.1 helix-turn-helix domain-containing protein [Serratia rubidaea]HDJ2774499.1 helix-turn-helix domain-containing protein [Serratia rubidaea]
MKTIAEQIGERIRALRAEKGLSQTQVAKLCGWSGASRVANYESGSRNVGADDAIVLARVLGVAPSELLFGDQGDPSLWLNDKQRKMLDLFNQLPEAEQERMIDLFQLRLKEIDDYVEKYLRGRYKPAE